jgi:hypothetical protein
MPEFESSKAAGGIKSHAASSAEREDRLQQLKQQAQTRGAVSGDGIRPGGAPFPVASPQTGYYKQPLLKEPQWTWAVPLYFFVGGAAGSLGVIGSLADVVGDDARLAEHARWMALGGAVLSGGLLIYDLGRPERFLHMLRIFKPQSVMSVGSWVLSAFSTFAGMSSFADLLRWKFGDSLAVSLISGTGRVGSVVFGMPFHNYTGVLLGVTAIPVWNSRVRSLPHAFGMSGMQSAASLLELAGHADSTALNLLAMLAASIESREAVKTAQAPGLAVLPAKQGVSGGLIQAGSILSGPVPLILRVASLFGRNRRLRQMAAVSGIAGSLLMRYGWTHAGSESARDWRIPMQVNDAV